MALDDNTTTPKRHRKPRWQAVFVEHLSDAPQLRAAICLQLGGDGKRVRFSGFPLSGSRSEALYLLWFFDAFAKAQREAHRLNVEDDKARAPRDPRW